MNHQRSRVGLAAGALAGALGTGTALALGGPIAPLLSAAGLILPLLSLFAPAIVALLGVSVLYLNLPGIAVTVHGLPPILAGSAYALLLMPLLVRLLLRREPALLDAPLLLIVAYLAAVLVSMFVSQDLTVAANWVANLAIEGLLVYFLLLNLFRTRASLTRLVDVVIVCGALLSALTLYQHVTHDYAQQFGGLAQRNLEYGTGEDAQLDAREATRDPDEMRVADRAGGPIGGPNRYAQILICLLPLIYFRMRSQGSLARQLPYAAAGGAALAAVFLTFSRGGFVGLAALVALATLIGFLRVRTVAVLAGGAALAVILWAPGYAMRLGTVATIPGTVYEGRTTETDGAIRGRMTEMMAALFVFLDHPIIGVGPGQYMPVYSQAYMNNPGALRHITVERRAHSMYFELAAENGMVGLGLFLAIVGLIQFRLWRAWRRWKRSRPDLAWLAGSFFLSISGYLLTAIFLQLAYQRYYWLLLGMAGVALQVLSAEARRASPVESASA